jgi:hypothetical protein
MSKTDTICEFVDTIVDQYSATKKKIRVDFYKYFQSEEIDRRVINEYASNYIYQVTDIIEEISGALDGDELLQEAYSHFKKPELQEFKSLLNRFVSDVERYKDHKKIVRRKKVKTPEQLVRGLHIQTEPFIIGENKYTSVPTDQIIGSTSVFLFNTVTHDLLFLNGESLSCKGAKITGYNNLSGLKKLKKVINTIDLILSSTPYNCCSIFDSLPNKSRSVPSTVSPNFALIKVLQ